MAVFDSCSVLLDLKTLPFKEKKKLRSAITENGGTISFVVNKQCSLIVTSDVSSLSSNRLRSIHKHQTPVVGVDYVFNCLNAGALLPVDEYKLDVSSASDFSLSLPLSPKRSGPLSFQVSKVPINKAQVKDVDSSNQSQKTETKRSRNVLEKFRIYTETDFDLPSYPDRFQVAKYSVFKKRNSNTWFVLELQSFKEDKGRRYRVVRYMKDGAKEEAVKDMLLFPSTSEEALEVYKTLRENFQSTGLQLMMNISPEAGDLGSAPLQQLLLEEKLNTGSLSQEVGVFVELLWAEAVGFLSNILAVPVNKLSLNDVSRAEGLLLQAQKKQREGLYSEVASLMQEMLTLLPHKTRVLPHMSVFSQKLDLCQLIRDLLNVNEMTLRSPAPSSLGKYRALRCSVEAVAPDTSEFQTVTALLQDRKLQVRQVLRVSRGVELQTFRSELGNVRPLLHSSSPRNFVGILSRGLLLPRFAVEHHGIERTDVGDLGGGIYFSDSVSTSLRYSKPGDVDGSRLLLVCDVALGNCRHVYKKDEKLTEAPEGHHSVHGVRRTQNTQSEFEDDEYVVYSPDQVKLKYVVQFNIEGEELKEFSPSIDTSAEPCPPPSDQELISDDDGLETIKNPLEDVTAGLLDSSGQQLPLQAVHVKCKLVDLLSQVIIFQKYTNTSSVPIEAKYVFPLDDSAAVCGFEAFINGKHVVGKVKEKEQARKEYKQAIEKGHGAYLMDQDAPDVFTISVGNLPPGASVLIKVTYVSETIVAAGGSIVFSLPGSVAPWQESAALNQTTQVSVEKVCVTDAEASTREFSLDMSIDMPYKITNLNCLTHKVKTKRTDCKAVVSVLPGEVLGSDGFQLSITLSEVHLPRMWVENHPDKDSQACMLVFYPDFDVSSGSDSEEVVVLLDESESMKGESLRAAKRIALQVLRTLDHNVRINVVLFGTNHTEVFLTSQPFEEVRQAAESFIKCSSSVGGSTELWRPLRCLSLLPPSRGVRNLLLLSDGHIQNAELTLQLLRDNVQHSRLFTCGLSPTANHHMLRALAQAGGGAYEFFDTKTKHNWIEKVSRQVKRMSSPSCSSVSVKWQQFNPAAPSPQQAPKQLHALFNDCHTLVYGFVPHCTQATLLGDLSGQEFKTMVSACEPQKTRGTFLHKLTARALIRDYEDGNLDTNEADHEGQKSELKSFIIELSKEFSILSQFTSFVAVEERDSERPDEGFTDVPKLISEEDVDFLPYISWTLPQDSVEESLDEVHDDVVDSEDLYGGSEDSERSDECFTDVPKLISEEDVDYLHYFGWTLPHDSVEESLDEVHDDVVDSEDLYGGSEVAASFMSAEVLMDSSPVCVNSAEDMSLPAQEIDEAHPLTEEMQSSRVLRDQGLIKAKKYAIPKRMKKAAGRSSGLIHVREPNKEVCVDNSSLMDSSPVCVDSAEDMSSRVQRSQICNSTVLMLEQKGAIETNLSAESRQRSHPGRLSTETWDQAASLCRASALSTSSGFSLVGLAPPPPAAAPADAPSSVPLALNGSSYVPPRLYHLGSLSASFLGLRPPLCLGSSSSVLPPPPPPVASAPPSSLRPSSSFGSSSSVLPPPPADVAPPSSLLPPRFQPVCFSRRLPPPPGASLPPLSGASLPPLSGASLPPPWSQAMRDSPYNFLSCLAPTPPPSSEVNFSHRPLTQVTSGTTLENLNLDQVMVDSATPTTLTSPQQLRQKMQDNLFARYFISSESSARNSSSLPTTRSYSHDAQGVSEATWRRSAHPPMRSMAIQPLDLSEQNQTVAILQKSRHRRLIRLRGSSGITVPEWPKIFQLQRSEGYWELTPELGELIDLDVDLFANNFLKSKGICSLGAKAHADILRLVATLLVLQLMRLKELEEGKLLRTLFSLSDFSPPRPRWWEEVKRAVDWVCWADRFYPCVCSRLEFGSSWDSSTRQLLGFEGLPPSSPLSGLNLNPQRGMNQPPMVH